MKLDGTFLRSKVARRVLLSFLLAAFIPFAFLATLYYMEANRMLVQQSQVALQGASGRYGRTIYDRLLLADQLLRSSAANLSAARTLAAKKGLPNNAFRSLTLIAPQRDAVALFGDTVDLTPLGDAALEHLRQGASLLVSEQAPGRGALVALIRAVPPSTAKLRLVVGELDPGYLWGDPSSFDYMTSFCVLNESYLPLYCSPPLIGESVSMLARAAATSAKGEFDWRVGQERYLAGFQEIFLEPKFVAPRWIVVAAQPESVALHSSGRFARIFWASVVLSVLVVALLSLTQIRRTLVPLERLIDGTRRLGRKDFRANVDVESADEFGELAGSFNAMATQLGRLFDTLTALSKIDRAILSELDMDRVVNDVLRQLKESFGALDASVSVIDPDSSQVRVHAVAGNGKRLPVARCTLHSHTGETLRSISRGLWMNGESAREMIPGCLYGLGAPQFFILPISWKDRLVGVVCLGYAVPGVLSEEDVAQIRDYADRVGVALSSAVREEHLYQQARTDALTGLPNRFHFMDRVKQDIALAQRDGRKMAILFADLDRFKDINDTLGHAAGDKLLREAAVRLQQCVRDGDMVARLGGDEFTILIDLLPSTEAAGTVAEHVIAALDRPFLIDGVENVVSASIGIAVFPSDGASVEELMRNADMAMYRAKERGRRIYAFFEETMNTEVVERNRLERELRRAIAERQFVLYYQPQVDPRTGRVHGAEALLRWRHPERGIVSPHHFMEVAERTGLIASIGDIVIDDACAQLRTWRDRGVPLNYVSVNVSARQFRRPDFVEAVQAKVRAHGIPAGCLELEITESVLVDGADAVAVMLRQLKGLGVQVAIDDFGTGYSSMSYLERLPFDTLKIDLSFVQKIREDGDGGTIAATIIAMAHTLGKKVVAEGAETQAQVEFLRRNGCELIQGHAYSRPLPPNELVAYVTERRAPKIRSAST
jgi:diguanylate cyclase (GGDEF)-like protein